MFGNRKLFSYIRTVNYVVGYLICIFAVAQLLLIAKDSLRDIIAYYRRKQSNRYEYQNALANQLHCQLMADKQIEMARVQHEISKTQLKREELAYARGSED